MLQPDFRDKVENILLMTGCPGEWLSFEVTERAVIKDAELVASTLFQLKELGISVQMDDFGIGYSSLSYLRNLPMDVIKIDRSFIHMMDTETDNPGLVRSIIYMAQEMGLKVVGEGIDTADQMAMLESLGCDYGQVYLIARPLDRDATESLLAGRRIIKLDANML